MRTTLHLVSMPWADPQLPSIQISVLKAYIDAVFGKRITTKTYSAFASIPLQQTRAGFANLTDAYERFEEYPYFLMYFRRFLRREAALRRVSLAGLIRKVNSCAPGEPLTLGKLTDLERRTQRYINDSIVPQLSKRDVNVVGFTLNYYQLYASIYCARYLRERFPGYRYVFVFGGATVIYPKVAEVLKALGLEGFCVIGEGERKLELMVREILATPSQQYSKLPERLATLHEGIYDIQRRTMDLYEQDPKRLLNLQTAIESLPLPDFDEYYVSLRKIFPDRKTHSQFRAETWLALEGSRGCFAHCDFCDVHMSWSGFRKSTPERIVAKTLELVTKYQNPRIKFMDNVCDTWAEKYAELLIARKIRIATFMECRVHHPETFWTKLSLAGVEMVQVGIEALSPGLLAAMNKGTRAKQNLLVQKWLRELGIESLSNLITHHPKSTLQHVAETRQVLQQIPHLERLDFSNLALLIGTPLDTLLGPEERRHLEERQDFDLPHSLDRYFVLKGEYESPKKWFAKGVLAAWDRLVDWEDKSFRKRKAPAFLSSTRYGPGQILIRDGRRGKIKDHHLRGATAQIYDLCQQGATFAALATETGLSPVTIEENLSWLRNQQLLVELDGYFVALALRPRDELVRNCMEQLAANRARPVAVSPPLLPLYPDTPVGVPGRQETI